MSSTTHQAVNNGITPAALAQYIPAHLRRDSMGVGYYADAGILLEIEVAGVDLRVVDYGRVGAGRLAAVGSHAGLTAENLRTLARALLLTADAMQGGAI